MTILIINTATPQATIILARDARILAQRSWPSDRSLGARLLSEIDTLLATQKISWQQIDRLAVHQGPGHYSALRTGVILATMVAFAREKELVALSGSGPDQLVPQAFTAFPVSTITPVYA